METTTFGSYMIKAIQSYHQITAHYACKIQRVNVLNAYKIPRIQKSVEEAVGLDGFRPKRSTFGAMEAVIEGVKTQSGTHYTRNIVLLATLDVRNAFNSSSWEICTGNHIPNPPVYKEDDQKLSTRPRAYQTEGNLCTKKITSDTAQGSILGPELWNTSCDEILKIDMPPDTYLVGYADTAVISGRDIEEIQR